MGRQCTHEGILVAKDSRKAKPVRVLLRETKCCWVTQGGTKYRKRDGNKIGETWPIRCLDLKSVKPLG